MASRLCTKPSGLRACRKQFISGLQGQEPQNQPFRSASFLVDVDPRRATLDDVQTALETIRVKLDGAPAKAATVNANVAIVKALLGFAHQVGYTRFNAAPLIKLRKAPRQRAQRYVCFVPGAYIETAPAYACTLAVGGASARRGLECLRRANRPND